MKTHEKVSSSADFPLIRPWALFSDTGISLFYWGTLFSFVAVKLLLRPVVLGGEAPLFLDIFVLSYPNFCEAIIGSFVTVNAIVFIYHRFLTARINLSHQFLTFFGLFITGFYVITQEFKVHNLGGHNVYDPYDVFFSLIGLACSYFLLVRGVENKKVSI